MCPTAATLAANLTGTETASTAFAVAVSQNALSVEAVAILAMRMHRLMGTAAVATAAAGISPKLACILGMQLPLLPLA